MAQEAFDAEGARDGADPAADDGDLIARLSARGPQDRFAEEAGGEGVAALPAVAVEDGEGVELAAAEDAVLPGGGGGRWLRIVICRQEGEGGGGLGRGGVAAEDAAVEVADLLGRGGRGDRGGSSGRLFEHEGAVQEEERLLRDGGYVAEGRVLVGRGEIERVQNARHLAAFDEAVDGAARGGRLSGERDGEAAYRSIEPAGGEEHVVAQGFDIEAAAVGAPEEAVLRVNGAGGGVVGGGLLVGGGEEDAAVEFFERPAGGDEVDGEGIEEFGMGGQIAAEAEVAGGGDEAGAEVVHPDAVDEDAGGERVVGVDEGLGEFEAAGAVGKGLLVAAAEAGEGAGRGECAGVVGVAAEEDVGGFRGRQVFDGHGAGRGAVVGGLGEHGVVADAESAGVVAVAFGVDLFELSQGDGGGVGEALAPAAEDVEIELAFADELFELGVGHGLRVGGGFAVLGFLGAEEGDHFGVAALAVFGLGLADALEALFVDGLVRGRAEERKLGRFAEVREDGVEGVVVFGGDGVELVVVAAGAGDGEAEEGAGGGVDAVVDGFGDAVGELAAEADEAEGGEVLSVEGGEAVGGELVEDELVVGQVGVEGGDDPIAIGVGPGVALGGVDGVVDGVGVAGEVEPVAAPAFAVVGGGEEAVDEFGVGVGGRVGGEGFDFGGGGGETGEVEADAADESAPVGGRGEGEAFGGEALGEQAVDSARGADGFLEGPQLLGGGALGDLAGHGGAVFDPTCKVGDDLFRQGRAGGHLQRLVGAAEGAEEEARVGVAGDEDGAGVASRGEAGGGVEPEAALGRGGGGAMAAVAAGGEDGADFRFEVIEGGRLGSGGAQAQESRESATCQHGLDHFTVGRGLARGARFSRTASRYVSASWRVMVAMSQCATTSARARSARAAAWAGSASRRRMRSAKAGGSSARAQVSPSWLARPSAPTVVETTGMPAA